LFIERIVKSFVTTTECFCDDLSSTGNTKSKLYLHDRTETSQAFAQTEQIIVKASENNEQCCDTMWGRMRSVTAIDLILAGWQAVCHSERWIFVFTVAWFRMHCGPVKSSFTGYRTHCSCV